jgi:hypothetical protein
MIGNTKTPAQQCGEVNSPRKCMKTLVIILAATDAARFRAEIDLNSFS